MTDSESVPLILESRHTGERLAIRSVVRNGEVCLELKGSLPAHREGPPLHIHFAEDEEGQVLSGTLSAIADGRRLTVGAGEPGLFRRGSAHRWWNDGDEPLVFEGFARPLVDLDRYLQAVFDVLNAGPPGRPPLFYMAHVVLRHRKTQAVLVMPPPIQAVLFRVIVLAGTLLGKYRGDDWPGCPARCRGVARPSPEATTSRGVAEEIPAR